MKRLIFIALLLGTATAVAAQAQAQDAPRTMYKDLIRPNGQPRSADVYQSAVDGCSAQTGQSRYQPDGAAMKKCMRSHGYQFMWQHGFASGSVRSAPASGGWHRCAPNWIAIGPCDSSVPHFDGPNGEYSGTY